MSQTPFEESIYAHIWDADELIALKNDPTHKPTWMKAGDIAELKPYCTANSFEKEAGTTVNNISRWHTFVIEFDDHEGSDNRVSIEDQRKLWSESDLPHTLRVYSGNASIHVIIRLVEDLNPSEWKKLSAALHDAFPSSDQSVLGGAERLCRMPKAHNPMTGKQQVVEYTGRRFHRKELVSWLRKKGCYVEGVDKYSLHTLHTLHNNPTTEQGQRIKQATEFLTRFEQHPGRKLYRQLIEKNFIPKPKQRNLTVINQAAFLYRAVSYDIAIQFMTAFYWSNCQLFEATLEEHLKEATTHWKSCNENYPAELTELELDIYSLLENETEQTLFRACRDFSANDCNGEPVGRFPLSAEQCRLRLGLSHDMQGGRLIQKFISRYGIIKLHQPGKKRAKGVKPKSAIYKWLLADPLAKKMTA